MRYCEISDSINESLENDRAEDQSCRLIRSGGMSSEMMSLVGDVESEMDEDFMDECDETFREAA
jgi:hypothetical protein